MNSIDLNRLYRNSIGFDRLASLLDNVMTSDASVSGYPPYNIEVLDDNCYAITLATAGFEQQELDIKVEKDVLTIRGEKQTANDRKFLHQGIANRKFECKFNLASHVEVVDADLTNGLLTINLVKEIPETMKPKTITINQNNNLPDQTTKIHSSVRRSQAESQAESQAA